MPICKAARMSAIFTMTFFSFTPLAAQTSAPQAPSAPTSPAAPSNGGQQGSIQPLQPVTLSPNISMPSMPKISSPVTGSNFYTPGKRFISQSDNSVQTQNNSDIKKSAASSQLESSLLTNTDADFSGLTAQDLIQLAQNGSITNISSLLGGASLFSNSTAGGVNNQILLKQILSELQTIKKNQNLTIASSSATSKPSALPPKILRFVVNANDVLSKCVQVYFSETESDGSFLLTGDARSLAENQTVSETFYILFKASGTKNSMTVYSVTPSLTQSQQAATPLSAFCSASAFTASRVGNLVTLRSTQDGVVCDLLLDIGNAR